METKISKDIDKYVRNINTDGIIREYYLICVVRNKRDRTKIFDNKNISWEEHSEFKYSMIHI